MASIVDGEGEYRFTLDAIQPEDGLVQYTRSSDGLRVIVRTGQDLESVLDEINTFVEPAPEPKQITREEQIEKALIKKGLLSKTEIDAEVIR